MGVKNRIIFGIHSITPYRRSDKLPYGLLEVLGGGNLELTGETEDLYGGSSRYPYSSEATQLSTNLTANVKSYPDFLMELFLGASVSTVNADSDGEVRGYANVKNSSVKQAATGIASVALIAGSKADLKFGKYVLVAVDATHVDVYVMSNIDFARGTDVDYLTDGLKIASALEITQSADTNVTGFGIKLVGGSGTIGMTAGDSAEFDVFPPHSGASEIVVGSSASQFPEFGAFMLAAKNASKEIFQIEAYRCVGSGMPIPLQEKQYAISDLTMKLLRDSTLDRVFKVTAIGEVD